MADVLDEKLKEILKNHGMRYSEHVEEIKQAFIDAGWKDSAFIAANTSLGRSGEMTGQEWYDRFEKELWHPPKQEYAKSGDDGESHDRFFRVGGQQFMYDRAIEAAKKAAGLERIE